MIAATAVDAARFPIAAAAFTIPDGRHRDRFALAMQFNRYTAGQAALLAERYAYRARRDERRPGR